MADIGIEIHTHTILQNNTVSNNWRCHITSGDIICRWFMEDISYSSVSQTTRTDHHYIREYYWKCRVLIIHILCKYLIHKFHWTSMVFNWLSWWSVNANHVVLDISVGGDSCSINVGRLFALLRTFIIPNQ